jgi:hypothetical protein
MLGEIYPQPMVDALYALLQVAAPIIACGVCLFYYFRRGPQLRYFLLFWLNLVLAAVGTGVWAVAHH